MATELDNFITNITTKLINEWDPLYYFNNSNESYDYSKVIERISPLTQEGLSVYDFAVKVRDIFIDEFGKDYFLFEPNECQHLIYDINRAIPNYLYPEREIKLSNNSVIKNATLKKLITGFKYNLEIIFANDKYCSEKADVICNGDADEYLLLSLNKSLSENVKIVCCNTCKFGNFNPYGGSDIFCFKTINVDLFNDKLDVLDNFTEEVLDNRHEFNYYCNHFKSQSNTYMYNSYHYYDFNPSEKPYNFDGMGKRYYDEKRQIFASFMTVLKEQYIQNEIECIPEFEEYLKFKFADANREATRRMTIFVESLSKSNQLKQRKFVNLVCSTCDHFNFYQIWTFVFSVPLCDLIFNNLKPAADLPDANFLVLKWLALYSLIYRNDKEMELSYLKKALAACNHQDEMLLKAKSYII